MSKWIFLSSTFVFARHGNVMMQELSLNILELNVLLISFCEVDIWFARLFRIFGNL